MGRATGLLHYRALDTEISSNEKTRSIHSPVPSAVITFQTQIPFHSSHTEFVEFNPREHSLHRGCFFTNPEVNVIVRYRHLSAYTGQMQGPQSSARNQLYAEI